MIGVPNSWKKDMREKGNKTEDLSDSLKKEKVKMVKTEDHKILQSGYFIRYLKKIIDHVSSLKDPSKTGLYDDLSDFLFSITPKLRKKEDVIFKKKLQNEFLESAKQLKSDGTLLMFLGELFAEKYPAEIRRASISNALKHIASSIGPISSKQ